MICISAAEKVAAAGAAGAADDGSLPQGLLVDVGPMPEQAQRAVSGIKSSKRIAISGIKDWFILYLRWMDYGWDGVTFRQQLETRDRH